MKILKTGVRFVGQCKCGCQFEALAKEVCESRMDKAVSVGGDIEDLLLKRPVRLISFVRCPECDEKVQVERSDEAEVRERERKNLEIARRCGCHAEAPPGMVISGGWPEEVTCVDCRRMTHPAAKIGPEEYLCQLCSTRSEGSK